MLSSYLEEGSLLDAFVSVVLGQLLTLLGFSVSIVPSGVSSMGQPWWFHKSRILYCFSFVSVYSTLCLKASVIVRVVNFFCTIFLTVNVHSRV